MPLYSSCIVSGIFKFTVFSICWQTALASQLNCKFTAEGFAQLDFSRMCQILLLTIEIVLINFHQSCRLFAVVESDKLRQRSDLELARRNEWWKLPQKLILWVTPAMSPTLTSLLMLSVDFLHAVFVSRAMGVFYVKNSAFSFDDGSC